MKTHDWGHLPELEVRATTEYDQFPMKKGHSRQTTTPSPGLLERTCAQGRFYQVEATGGPRCGK